MKYSDFEKHIADTLGNDTAPVDMGKLLSDLNLKQPWYKTKGFFFGLTFLMTASMLIFYSFHKSEQQDLHSDLIENIDLSIDKNNKSDLESSPKEASQSQNTQEKTQLSSGLNHSNNSIITTASTPTSTFTSTIQKEVPVKDEIVLNNSNETTSYDYSKSQSKSFENSPQPYERPTKNKSTTQTPKKINTKAKTNSNASEILNSKNTLEYAALSMKFDDVRSLKTDKEDLFSRMRINCPSFNIPHWRIALIPEVGIFLPSKNLSTKGIESPLAYQQRISNESTLEGINVGLYGMLIRDRIPFFVKAGISYSRIAEKMELEYEYVERDTTVGIVSSTVSANGDTITHVYGDVITETLFKGKNQRHYYVHLFDFPVSVGYNTFVGGLDLSVEAGMKFNFMTRGTGNILTGQNTYANLTLEPQFKNRIDMSFFGGFMVGRHFNNVGDFYLAPRFTFYPSDFSNQDNPIKQSYMTFGLNAGFIYKL